MTRVEFEELGHRAIRIFRLYIFISLGFTFLAYLSRDFNDSAGSIIRDSIGPQLAIWFPIILFSIIQIVLLVELFRRTINLGIRCSNCNWRALIIKNNHDLSYLRNANSCPKCRGVLVHDA